MKILVIGAGVVGATNAWQLAESGSDVTLCVRPGKKALLDTEGVVIRCTDRRVKPAQQIRTVFRPRVVEHFSPSDGYELILVAVRSNQVETLLPSLAAHAGSADILFFTNNFWGDEKIRAYLPIERCLFGFSPMVGGWRTDNEINCILFDQTSLATMLGEADGQTTPRLICVYELFAGANLRPEISPDILGWLATHYVEYLGAIGGILLAGSAQGFVCNADLVERSLLATREALNVCRARGVRLRKAMPLTLKKFFLPLDLVVPLARGEYAVPDNQHFFEDAIAHHMREISGQYHDVLSEGRRLGVSMPNLEFFEACFAETSDESAAEFVAPI